VVKPLRDVKIGVAASGKVTVSWESENVYPVTYTLYASNLSRGAGASDLTIGTWSGEKKYFNTVVYGEGTVLALAGAAWPNDYYPGVESELVKQQYNIAYVSGVTAPSPAAKRIGATDKVTITFDNSIAGAAGYTLQKTTYSSSGQKIPTDAVWTQVDGTQTVIENNTISIEDTVAVNSAAAYRVIVHTSLGASYPSSLSNTVSEVKDDHPVLDFTVSSRISIKDDFTNYLDTGRSDIVFTFNSKTGYAYAIYKQKAGEANGTGSDVKDTYTLQTTLKPAEGPDGKGTVKYQYTPLDQRQKYYYQLRVYKDNVEIARYDYYNSSSYYNPAPVAAKSVININSVSVTKGSNFG
jgi:hypothetical protein